MPDLDALEQEVNNLDEDNSPLSKFKDAMQHIEVASRTTPNANLQRIRDILSTFRSKVPDMLLLKRVKADAKDLDETLTLDSLEERIAAINARNFALTNLTKALNDQSANAVHDAELLKLITGAVDKATETVTAIKTLVDQLQEADGNARATIKAFIDALDKVSSIFRPQNA